MTVRRISVDEILSVECDGCGEIFDTNSEDRVDAIREFRERHGGAVVRQEKVHQGPVPDYSLHYRASGHDLPFRGYLHLCSDCR